MRFNIKKHRPTLQFIAAWILLLVGCGLLIAGFIVPPPGEIHNSVLIWKIQSGVTPCARLD